MVVMRNSDITIQFQNNREYMAFKLCIASKISIWLETALGNWYYFERQDNIYKHMNSVARRKVSKLGAEGLDFLFSVKDFVLSKSCAEKLLPFLEQAQKSRLFDSRNNIRRKYMETAVKMFKKTIETGEPIMIHKTRNF